MNTPDRLQRHHERVTAMLADERLNGDLLLIGIALARIVDLTDPPWPTAMRDIARQVYGAAYHGRNLAVQAGQRLEDTARIEPRGIARLKSVLYHDVRRYSVDTARSRACQRPTARRGVHLAARGELCGRRADYYSREYTFVDPVDGTMHLLGACTKPICRTWWHQLADDNRRELTDNPPPEPAANHGGVLESHLPELDWPLIYGRVDPQWRPPHEAPGWRPPQLVAVTGGQQPDDDGPVRPALTVLRGGWR